MKFTFTDLLPYIAPVVTAALGWVAGRREKNVQIEGNELENVEKGLKIYREMIADLKERVEFLEKKNLDLQRALDEYKAKQFVQ